MRVNLGSVDTQALGVDHTQCTAGSEPDVSAAAAARLVEQGWAEPVQAVAKPAAIQGIPKKAKAKDDKASE